MTAESLDSAPNGAGRNATALIRVMAARAGWPEPLPLTPALVADPFPVDALGLPLARVASALAATFQVPVEYAVGVLLAFLSAAGSGRLEVDVRSGQPMPAVLWVLAVMPSASGKSSVLRPLLDVFGRWEADKTQKLSGKVAAEVAHRTALDAQLKDARQAFHEARVSGARQQAAHSVAALERQLADSPRTELPLIRASDITPEALVAKFLPLHGERAAVLASEGTFLRVAAGRYARRGQGGSWESLVAGFDGDPVERDRVGDTRDPTSGVPIRLKSPRISVLQAIQPNVLRRLLATDGFREQGVLGRFLPLVPADLRGSRSATAPPFPAEVRTTLDLVLSRLLNNLWNRPLETSVVLSVSEDGRAAWEKFWTEIERGRGPGGPLRAIDPFSGRAAEIAGRVAALLHVADRAVSEESLEGEITGPTMRRAIAIVRGTLSHAQRLWAGDVDEGTTDRAQAARDWLLAKHPTVISRREVHQGLRGWFPRAADVDDTMELLAAVNVVRPWSPLPDERRRAGRPTGPRWEVSPRLWDADLKTLNISKPLSRRSP